MVPQVILPSLSTIVALSIVIFAVKFKPVPSTLPAASNPFPVVPITSDPSDCIEFHLVISAAVIALET